MHQTVTIKGTVDSITYENKDSGYTVIKLKTAKELITVTGSMPFISKGDFVIVNGNYVVHPQYGSQFKCESFEVEAPQTQSQILKYLSSGAIKGVGPATALKIVKLFGDDTLDIIENFPARLTVIKGISPDKANAICESYKQQFGIRDIMLTLSKYKISPNEATLIFKTLGVQSIDIIKHNPYALCKSGIDFSFDRVDEIAENFGINLDNKFRIGAGITHVLKSNLSNGHTCLPYSKLVDVSARMLQVEKSSVASALDNMIEELTVFSHKLNSQTFVFLPEYAAAEEFIASNIKMRIANNKPLDTASETEIKLLQNRLGFEFDLQQINAVNCSLENSFFVLTGRPGTGKTTTLNAIIDIFDRRRFSIGLCAPTGRAAKRITELTGRNASTLHRLLEYEWGNDSKPYFGKNQKNQLEYDVIIVDEMSMVDSLLFRALLEACKISTRIILVGDSDQLPSVGAGNVLNDIIASDAVPFLRLDKIFRQASQSSIVTFAHDIIKGNVPENFEKANDFFFIKRPSPFSTVNTVVELCTDRLPAAFGYSSVNDIQVLCPSRKRETGTNNLNNMLQDVLNPLKKGQPEMHFKGNAFRVGDKVMHIKNDYDIVWESDLGESGMGIFNGDIGFVEEMDLKNRTLKVRYDDRVATYFDENLELLELAYAITVHKAQGCEFNCIVIPMSDISQLLCYRNLLYTAITRAKKLIVLVGDPHIFQTMIENDRKTLRYTALKHFLCEARL